MAWIVNSNVTRIEVFGFAKYQICKNNKMLIHLHEVVYNIYTTLLYINHNKILLKGDDVLYATKFM